MRDYRDAKAMAQSIRAALAAKGAKITIAESLELIAKAFGAADWNTLSAAINAAEADKPAEPPAAPPDNNARLDRVAAALGWTDWDALTAALHTVRPDQPGRRPPGDRGARLATPPFNNMALEGLALALGWTNWNALTDALRTVSPDQAGRRPPTDPDASLQSRPAARAGTMFSPAMEVSLHRAVGLAAERRHGYTTLEHLLLALTQDPDAASVMIACQVDLASLQTTLVAYVDEQLKRLTEMGEPGNEPPPTAGFHRVVQRAVIHVQSSGRDEVTGANLLVAIFSERESHACTFLEAQRMNRYDAVNFIAHGIRKDGGRAA